MTVGARGLECFPDILHEPIVFDGESETEHELELGPGEHVATGVVVHMELVARMVAHLQKSNMSAASVHAGTCVDCHKCGHDGRNKRWGAWSMAETRQEGSCHGSDARRDHRATSTCKENCVSSSIHARGLRQLRYHDSERESGPTNPMFCTAFSSIF